eukprot:COSAG06_NODE_2125_length_7539_cov_1.564651_2_plen_58_part_00
MRGPRAAHEGRSDEVEEDGALGSGQATRGRENRLCAGEDPGVSGLGFNSVGGVETAA